MTLVIDIDDTIIFSRNEFCSKCGNPIYKEEKVDCEEIQRINNAYDKGHFIIFYTGRDWQKFEETQSQLKRIGVSYHKLVMGKPQGIYVDKEAIKSLRELNL